MSGFRILSLDGGGIKGVFTASFLTELEAASNKPVADHFDLIAGTSTGGIIALGLGLGLSAKEILNFYTEHGKAIFPRQDPIGRAFTWVKQLLRPAYAPGPLRVALEQVMGNRRLGESCRRLVIPAFDAEQGQVYIFKTAHHPHLKKDFCMRMVDVALSTSAAPTYLPCFSGVDGHSLIDGGVWANNPCMVALTEAMGMLEVPLTDISILSIGTTSSKLSISHRKRVRGGKLLWAASAVDLLMHGQSVTATHQAWHLLRDERFIRINPTVPEGKYSLDRSSQMVELVDLGKVVAKERWGQVAERFLYESALPFKPVYTMQDVPQHEKLRRESHYAGDS